MGIQCCGGMRRCILYKIVPQDGFVLAFLEVLTACPVCGNFAAKLTRLNSNGDISVVNKSKSHAIKLFSKLENSILFKYDRKAFFALHGKFYLNYNEFGRKKRCYSNISALKSGLQDPYDGLDFIKLADTIKF